MTSPQDFQVRNLTALGDHTRISPDQALHQASQVPWVSLETLQMVGRTCCSPDMRDAAELIGQAYDGIDEASRPTALPADVPRATLYPCNGIWKGQDPRSCQGRRGVCLGVAGMSARSGHGARRSWKYYATLSAYAYNMRLFSLTHIRRVPCCEHPSSSV